MNSQPGDANFKDDQSIQIFKKRDCKKNNYYTDPAICFRMYTWDFIIQK